MRPVYKRMRIAQLKLDPQNPRDHREADIDFLKRSLSEHGHVLPLLVQENTKQVIAGNGQLLAMRDLGWKTCDVAVIDVDDASARRLSVKLNRSAELSRWDPEKLQAALNEIGDLSEVGFTEEELDAIIAEAEAEVEAETEQGGRASQNNPDDEQPEQYLIVIECASESQQTELLERFAAEGLQCRARVT